MNKRLNFLDIAKGISIMLVAFGHIVSNESNIIRIWLYSFHMPLFFIISGCLLNLTNNKRTLREFIMKKIPSLLLPYLSFAIINYFFLMAVAWRGHYLTLQLAIDHVVYIFKLCGRSAIWFLPCIFISEVSFKLINENISNFIIKISITTLIFIIPFFIKAQPDTLLLSLLRSCTAIGFITIGNYLFNIITKINLSNLQLVFIFLVNIFLTYVNGAVDLFELKFNNPVYYTINSIIGTLAIIFLSKKLNENKALEYYGKNSLIVMGTHIMLISVYNVTLAKIFNSYIPTFYSYAYPIIALITVISFEYGVIYFFNTYLGFLLGKHKKKQEYVNLSV
ncbi:O-acetyltransferase [Clostridium gelidum]|uniref:O-acetyltransferase n=1 Tax=Clostridium gelidum TaxID=704125 RepID=A0ABM7SWJ3_9CLOT|nr:acyltransferase family protein [Clostridium gelidum]BCZ44058.1 O-acetyltransferase [Clostridium gelidum]